MTKYWAIEPSFLAKYREFKKKVKISSTLADEYLEKIKSLETDELIIVEEVAVIDIVGSLSDRSDFYSWLFDRTVYGYRGIIEKLNTAESDPRVARVQLRVNSPGGRLDGLFNLLYRIQSFSKPIESLVGPRADSAAYGIVSQTDKIIAENEMSEVGSVGVGTSFFIDEEIIDITSTAAPDKWPDVTKSAGVAVVRSELDEIHEKFASIIAAGRSAATGKSITADTVNINFGKGGTMLAASGLKSDMVDEVLESPQRVSNAYFFTQATDLKSLESVKPEANAYSVKTFTKSKDKKSNMDIKTLKNEHSDVYEAAFKEGAENEKSRVAGLMVAGKASGKMDYAVECVEKGLRITDDVVFATFKTAEITKESVDDRGKDDPKDLKTPPDASAKEDEKKEVADFVAARKARTSA